MRSIFFSLSWILFSLMCCASSDASDVHPVIVPQSSLLASDLPHLEEDEVRAMDRLIRTTKEQLILQEQLRDQMVRFKAQKEAFIQGEQTKRHAGMMVRTAREILETISQHHLQYLFSADYIQELTLFSSIAGKNGIKRP